MKTLFNLQVFICSAVFLSSSCGGDEPMPALIVKANFETETMEDGVVNFVDQSENAVSYVWDFGDNSGSNEKNPSHIYATSGTYTVLLTAAGADGTTSEKSSTVTVLKYAGPNLVNGAELNGFDDTFWDEINFRQAKATFTYNGSVLFNGDVNATAMIYQIIEVEANKKYQLSVDVNGSNLDQAMVGAFLLQDEPSLNFEPQVEDAFVQWNTLCGNSGTIAGDLVERQCRLDPDNHVGEDGTITFSEPATIYLGIKVEVFGAWGSGVSINKVSFRLIK
jgi:hypothetical protein